jgi:hypothetical protein
MMHHKRIVIDQIHESDGFAGHALAADPFDSCSGQAPPPLHRLAEPCIISRLRWINSVM